MARYRNQSSPTDSADEAKFLSPALILHRTRVDAEGRLALTRLDNQFREQWKTVLPYTELMNRWEWPDRLLMMGTEEIGKPGSSRRVERIVAVSLADGRMQVAR